MLGSPARLALSRQLGLTGVYRSKLVFRLDAEAARALAMAFRDVFNFISEFFSSPSVKFAAMRTLLEFGVVFALASFDATFFDHVILDKL